MPASISYPDGIAIWKLIFYTPALVGSIWVSCRHGLSKSSGWIFLAIFTVLRLISSAAQLATISSKTNTAETVALVTGSLGLSPLLLACLGILSRVHYTILKSPWNMIFSVVIIRVVQIPATIALITCIVGATNANAPSEISTQPLFRVGVVLFLVVFIMLLVLTIGAAIGRRMTQRGETMLLYAVAISLPFLLVRITYSLIFSFSGDKSFTSSTTAGLLMTTIEEMIVVLIYIWAGLLTSCVPEEFIGEKSDVEKLAHRAGRGDFNGGRLGLVSLGAAVMSTVIADKKGDAKAQK